eukprot:CAMPEP_0115882980 /NCGR_PEP_ID=MMETSP0287-20121206/29310_1 /TAXON_ID=412157 /ORGANISM="Chrysochromulina rotalis, Strain UIO044" /LENGTH=48 /DNA_ID= /DNA_START= /DNA_END= /DNA_ORIENTATION=
MACTTAAGSAITQASPQLATSASVASSSLLNESDKLKGRGATLRSRCK